MTLRRTSIALAAAVLWAGAAQATPISFTATLSGANENPPVASPGTGTATVTFDALSAMDTLLSVSVSFSGLVGTTTVAHIHCCVDAPGTIGVATHPGTFPGFPAGVTSGSYTGSWLLETGAFTSSFLTASGGTAEAAAAALLAGLNSGRAYLNVHTSHAPAGEIRGFLRPVTEPGPAVPEPGALLVFASALAVVAGSRRR